MNGSVVLDGGLLLGLQYDIAAGTGSGKRKPCRASIHHIRKRHILRALDLGAVFDVDDARAQHDAAVGVDLPADIDGFVVGIGPVPECVNGSQSDVSSRIG